MLSLFLQEDAMSIHMETANLCAYFYYIREGTVTMQGRNEELVTSSIGLSIFDLTYARMQGPLDSRLDQGRDSGCGFNVSGTAIFAGYTSTNTSRFPD